MEIMRDDLIHDIGQLMALPQFDKTQMTHLMISLRKLTELMTDAERSQYPTLKLYCNWCAHTGIDAAALAAVILHELHQKLLVLMHVADNDRLIHELSAAFSFAKLRSEMSTLLTSLGLPADLTTDDGWWKEFCRRLLGNIRGVPIRFPSKKTSKKTQHLQAAVTNTPLKPGFAVAEATIVDVDKGIFEKAQLPKGEFMVCMYILFTNGVSLIVPMTLAPSPGTFPSPTASNPSGSLPYSGSSD